MIRYLFSLLFFLAVTYDIQAQRGSNVQEVWPSIDMYYRLNPSFRLYGTFAGTKKETSYTEGSFGLFLDYYTYKLTNLRRTHAEDLPGKFVWLRVGYQRSGSPPSIEDDFRENMLVTEANGRFYLPQDILLTFKNRFDWRFSDGDFKGRYRPRLSFDKDLHTRYLSFTLNALIEYYANFGSGSVNRFRSQVGMELRVTENINYEVYWSHQFRNDPEIPTIDAFGMSIKGYFSRKPKENSGKSKKSKH